MRKSSLWFAVFLSALCFTALDSLANDNPLGGPILLDLGDDHDFVASLKLRPVANPEAQAVQQAEVKSLASSRMMPALSVDTQGPDTMVVGQPATYTVRLTNPSGVTARNVSLRISLPSWVEPRRTKTKIGSIRQQERLAAGVDLIWDIDRVPAHSANALNLDVVPRRGLPFEFLVNMSVRPSSSQAQIEIHEAKVDVEFSGTEDMVFGEDGEWQVTVSNPGTAAADGVSLDILADETSVGTVEVGRIPASGERIVDVKMQPLRVGKIQLRAVAQTELGLEASAIHHTDVRRASLSVDLQGPEFRFAGTTATYKVRVHNSGNAPAEPVTVDLSLPENTRYLGGVDVVDVSTTGLSWVVDRLESGHVREFDVQCELQLGGEQAIAVQVSTPDDLIADDSLVTRVQMAADLELKVTDPKGPQSVADTATYEIHVSNRGSGVARQVYIVAVCPPHLEPIDVSGNAAINAGQIFFRPVNEIAPGQEITHTVSIRAREAGSHLFRVVVGCKDPDMRLAAEDTTRFFVPPTSRSTIADRSDSTRR